MEQVESATNTFLTSNSVFKTQPETWHTPSPPNVLHRQLPQIPYYSLSIPVFLYETHCKAKM
ncbi:hypothetical protein PanWU01x14_095030 [Parasponia andersonii]|uniref:Uncharacterized protein n=1 Tax=Parasponia andersonii TaxID=3476 RepID=A0A2P5D5F5_PARAD|nr:hypothetical protein PanWU01x14_095030 [Parasponia andersonii]